MAADVTEARIERESDAAQVSESMYDVMRCHNSLRARVAGVEGELTALFLLVKLWKHGPCRASELAETMNADASTVSRQVAVLVKAGFIERQADPDDGRASILVPTEQGRARVQQFIDDRTRSTSLLIDDWSVADRRTFIRLLDAYTASMEKHRDEILTNLRTEILQFNASARSERSH